MFSALAADLLAPEDSAAYNQAIMDLGATVCTPRNARCAECVLQLRCVAFNGGVINDLPVRSKKTAVRTRYFHYLLLKCEDELWMNKRTGNDIWENLYQPFLIEADGPLEISDVEKSAIFETGALINNQLQFQGHSVQRLTHQLIDARFFSVSLTKKPAIEQIGGEWMNPSQLQKAAMPKTVLSFLRKNLYF